MVKPDKSPNNLLRENTLLRQQLAEAREILSAIQQGEIDALVVQTPQGEKVFTIRGAEEPYRLFVEQMAQGAVTLNNTGTILYCNRRFASLLNTPLESLIGSSIYQYASAEDQAALSQALERANRQPCKAELVLTPGQGANQIPFELSFNPLGGEELPIICMVATDLRDQKQAETRLRAALREKETLLREVHHRVKNNMQIITSLLKLQAENIKDEKVVEMFYESQNRVKAMALVHQKLYQSRNFSQVDISVYIQSLVGDLMRSLDFDHRRISVVVRVAEILLNMDTAIPCGLIINELVYNAIKYAFPADRKGVIEIQLDKDPESGRLYLVIRDDGIGLPPEIDPENAPTLGLQLVAMLTRQLEGVLEVTRAGGTTFSIQFQELKYRERI